MQDIDKLAELYRLAPCPYCASSAIELVRRKTLRVFVCGGCHVEVTPRAWHQFTDAEAVIFWNRCRSPRAPVD